MGYLPVLAYEPLKQLDLVNEKKVHEISWTLSLAKKKKSAETRGRSALQEG